MGNDMSQIEHLVILMMENRSFDHFLGALTLEGRTDIEGLANPPRSLPDLQGNLIPQWDMAPSYFGYADPPHGPAPQTANYHGGANDGFVQQYQLVYPTGQSTDNPPRPAPANIPMGYYTRDTLPVYYSLADTFTVCDHWFSSMLSSTWPNRKYLVSGHRDDDTDTQTLPGWRGFETTPIYDVVERCYYPGTHNKLTWRSYFTDLPFFGFWYWFAASHALTNFSWIDQFVKDCQADQLPTISVIDPPFSLADDHPSHDVRLGQKFVGLIVDALTHSEVWHKTALVILYDENGGFYDHVAPGPVCAVYPQDPEDTIEGFRVPAIVVSAYPADSRVSKVAFDHTSIIKSISERWSVDFDPKTFGPRFQCVPSIWDSCFNFNREPLSAGTYTQPQADQDNNVRDPMADLSWTAGIHELAVNEAGSLEAVLERIMLLPELKTLDNRAKMFDSLSALETSVNMLKQTFRAAPIARAAIKRAGQ
jgi:phospholipase C